MRFWGSATLATGVFLTYLVPDTLLFIPLFKMFAAFGDVHFMCVGTPQQAGSNAADVSHIDACVDALAPHLDRPALFVGKSTVPVGTARRLSG